MSYNVETIEELKALARKYPSLKAEYAALVDQLEVDPVSIADAALGKGCYKIRVAIASKGTGKSGGARVIYYISIDDDMVCLLSVFDKSDQDNLPKKTVEMLRGKAIAKVIPKKSGFKGRPKRP